MMFDVRCWQLKRKRSVKSEEPLGTGKWEDNSNKKRISFHDYKKLLGTLWPYEPMSNEQRYFPINGHRSLNDDYSTSHIGNRKSKSKKGAVLNNSNQSGFAGE